MSSKTKGAASAAPTLTELADGIRADLAEIEGDNRSALAHAITAGEKLNQAKAQLEHGEWLPWLKENFGLADRTARRYMSLGANRTRVSDFGSIREALAALPKKPKAETPKDQQRKYGNNHWENDDVLAWVARRMKAGRTRDEIFAESQAGAHDWPLPGCWLPKNTVDICRGILRDRKRRGDTNRVRQPKESGKRLRQLHAEKRAGRSGSLWHLQKAVAEAVGVLEGFDLGEPDWSEETQMLILEIHEDLDRLAIWNAQAMEVLFAQMDDLNRQRKLQKLRHRAEDPSSSPTERQFAAEAATRLERRRLQQLAN